MKIFDKEWYLKHSLTILPGLIKPQWVSLGEVAEEWPYRPGHVAPSKQNAPKRATTMAGDAVVVLLFVSHALLYTPALKICIATPGNLNMFAKKVNN